MVRRQTKVYPCHHVQMMPYCTTIFELVYANCIGCLVICHSLVLVHFIVYNYFWTCTVLIRTISKACGICMLHCKFVIGWLGSTYPLSLLVQSSRWFVLLLLNMPLLWAQFPWHFHTPFTLGQPLSRVVVSAGTLKHQPSSHHCMLIDISTLSEIITAELHKQRKYWTELLSMEMEQKHSNLEAFSIFYHCCYYCWDM